MSAFSNVINMIQSELRPVNAPAPNLGQLLSSFIEQFVIVIRTRQKSDRMTRFLVGSKYYIFYSASLCRFVPNRPESALKMSLSSVEKFAKSSDGTPIFARAVGDSSKPSLVFVHGMSLSGVVFDDLFKDKTLLDRFYLVRKSISSSSSFCLIGNCVRFLMTYEVMDEVESPLIRPRIIPQSSTPTILPRLSKLSI